MTAIGLGFKVAAAPFHFWAPDVYQGAPAPSAAFIASGSKVASFFIFFQIAALGLAGAEGTAALPHLVRGWVPVLASSPSLSMLLGNLVAIRQTSLRRLLAYSAIAHAGYMLLGHRRPHRRKASQRSSTTSSPMRSRPSAPSPSSPSSKSKRQRPTLQLRRTQPPGARPLLLPRDLHALARRNSAPRRLLRQVLPLRHRHRSTPRSLGLLWLVVLAIAMSAVSLYYYLRVLKSVYVTPLAADIRKIQSPILSQILVALLAAAVMLLGCAPHLLLKWIWPPFKPPASSPRILEQCRSYAFHNSRYDISRTTWKKSDATRYRIVTTAYHCSMNSGVATLCKRQRTR